MLSGFLALPTASFLSLFAQQETGANSSTFP